MSRSALVAGATGLVGGLLLQRLLEDPVYDEVKAVVRRSLPLRHPRLIQIIDPLTDLAPLAGALAADDWFCCLGTTRKKAGSREAFRRVDYDLPLALARLARQNNARHFLVISAMGASRRSPSHYSRVKGELEEALQALALPRLSILRPSLLLGERAESRPLEDVGQQLAGLLNPLMPRDLRAIAAEDVAVAMQAIAHGDGPSRTYLSGELKTLADGG